ncbi:hypothetical protein LINPERPRIM_LOCUS4339 [Linum perenne]
MAAAAVPALPTAAPANFGIRRTYTGSILPSTWKHPKIGSFRSLRLKSTRKLVVRASRTESKGVSLGFKAPDFQLPEPLTGKTWELEDFESHPGLLVMFICNHCPFVKHLKKVMANLSNFYMKDGRRPFELVYHGQFDDSRPNSNVPITGRDLSRAIDCVLSAQPVPSAQTPSIGCSIKWHPETDL